MGAQPIDWDELEEYEWRNHGNESLKSASSRLSSQVVSTAIRSVTDVQPFLNYTSFISYVSAFNVDLVPHTDLQRLERLGLGATRTVFRGKCLSRWGDTEIAIKRLNLEIPRTESTTYANTEELRQQMAETSLELRILSNDLLRFQANIVDLLAVSWEELKDDPDHDPVSIRPLLVTELACQKYPTLDDYFNHARSCNEMINAELKVSLLSDVASALSAVHVCGVIHGDIKPQNVLLFRQRPEGPLIAKISDFGGCHASEELERTNPQLKDFVYSMAGTEYWNAPEANSRDNPDFGCQTRDYYSLGLLALYILFEEPPFGDERDISSQNLERIGALKSDTKKMEQLVKAKFDSRWRLTGRTREVIAELSLVKGFYERQEKLQALIDMKQVFEVFNDGSTWTATTGDENRQYAFLFVISQFLRRDPKTRRQGGLMNDLGVFLNDKDIARSLRDIYLMQAWQTFWSAYELGDVTIWHIATLFRNRQNTVQNPLLSAPASGVSISWKTPLKNLSSEFSRDFDMEKFEQLPSSLQEIYLKELERRLRTESGPSRLNILLGLAYCESLGHETEGPKYGYLLEAARHGSNIAKRGVLALLEAEEMTLDIESHERVQWLYDIVFAQIPSKDVLKARLQELILNQTLHARVLTKVFEAECLQSKAVRGTAIRADVEDNWVNRAFECTKEGDLSRLSLLLEEDSARVKEASVQGVNLLHTAVEYGHPKIVQILCQQYDMSIDSPTADGLPPIVLALRAHDLDTMAALLAQGADHNAVLGAHTLRCIANYGGPRALRQISYFVSLWKEVDSRRADFPLKDFLDGNFSVREEKVPDDEPDLPPIFLSILGDNLGTLWSLLEMGCSVDLMARFTSGLFTPLHVAANLRPLHLALLLHYGADSNLRTGDADKLTALQIACVAHSMPRYTFPRVITTNVLQQEGKEHKALGIQPTDYTDAKNFAVRALCGYGAMVDAQDWVGRTALAHCMTDPESLPVAMMLVDEYAADIRIKDFRGLSCLHRAVLHQSNTTFINFCVERGVPLDEPDINGLTPLMMAVTANKNLDTVRALVRLGANCLLKQNKGWTALDLAIKARFDEAVDFLFGQAVNDQDLIAGLMKGKDVLHQTLLHRLLYREESFFDRYEIYLPQNIVQDLVQGHDIVGYTLLHHAILACNITAVEFLLRHKADVNAEGWHQLRPLHIACGMGVENISILLRNAGADQEICDADGRTPEDFSDLCANSGTFWNRLMKECLEDGDRLARLPSREEMATLEQEARAKARENGRL
ncbi:MAG: hypothetical protein Q9166_006322 [cf. Caloplaca sp. 2 TL-2023]